MPTGTTAACWVEGCSEPRQERRARCVEHERRWRNAGKRGPVSRPHALVALALETVGATLESDQATRVERLTAAAVLPDLLTIDAQLHAQRGEVKTTPHSREREV